MRRSTQPARFPLLGAAVLVAAISLPPATAAEGERPAPREYTLELTTSVTAPAFAMPAGMPAGMSIPGMADPSRPSRSISGEAVYRTAAVEPIFVTVPASIGLPENRLILRVNRPEEMPDVPAERGEGAMTTPEMDMTTKLFWHPETASGPIVTNIHVPAMNVSASGSWPATRGRARTIVDRTATGSEDVERMGSIGKGAYVLNTGNVAMPLDGFLLPVTVTSPSSLTSIDPAAAIEVVWNPDTAARGYILHGRGMIMEGQTVKEMVLWVSTESAPPERVREGYEPPRGGGAAAIDEDVRNRVLLPPGSTRCVVPPGIFRNVDFFTLTVTAVGADFSGGDTETVLKGRIRSTWTATRMKGMDAMMGVPGGMRGYETPDDYRPDEE
jgi:hypothetical protein